MKMVRTIDDVIEALGGPTALSRDLDLESAAAVSNWPLRGYIPRGWHLILYLKLKALGYEIDPAIFGLDAEVVQPRLDPVMSLPG